METVGLGDLFLTDNPIGAPFQHDIAPLSFIPGGGYAVFTADGNANAGPDHVDFKLSSDQGMIAQEEVETHRMHHVLTRAIGGPDENLEGDMHHVGIHQGDRLLLCTDGLTDMAKDDDIAGVLERHPRSEDACRALVALALERGGRDNVTAIVARFTLE